MARPIEFIYDDVIVRATNQFWKDGYVASSVQKLLDATGINRGTMYNSFGEKEAFFRTCVVYYNGLLRQQTEATLGESGLKPESALNGFFQLVVTGMTTTQRSYGCMLVNCVCDSIQWEDGLAKLVKDSLAVIRKALLVRTRELEKSRKLAKRVNAEFAADQLMNLYLVSKLNARAGKSPKQLLEHINFSLAAILK